MLTTKKLQTRFFLLLMTLLVVVVAPVFAEEAQTSSAQNPEQAPLVTLTPVADQGSVLVQGMDSENDKGGSIDLSWEIRDPVISANATKIQIFRKAESDAEFTEVKHMDISALKYADKKEVQDNIKYSYILNFLDKDNRKVYQSGVMGPFVAYPQWFNTSKFATLFFAFITIAIVLLFIQLAKQGKKFYVRPLGGIKAIEDAVGRATEMGKPCVYVPGISMIEDIATLASISILSKISEVIANYQSRIVIPNYDPIVYSVIDEVVKSAYVKAGRPDAYRSEDVYYLTGRQFAYASGIAGLMAREKPAANFFLGWFMAESLILAEAGSMTGAIQIAGTDSISQIPFFIVACDYTLIGEELYAAAAYMGQDVRLLGGLKGQDYVKLFLMLTLIVLFILKLCGVPGIDTILVGGN
ncbi:MAG: hypothetical protein HQK50_07675 [Oligoflexia bacterium]|nr:hypothetical protein [Oligoflexia bacterium]